MDGGEPKTNFIEVIDNVFSKQQCEKLIQRIDESPNRTPGRTGSGVDAEKKLSEDVSITNGNEFSDLLPGVLQATSSHLFAYFKKYYFALIGPIALTVVHPKTGKLVKLTADNFAEVGAPNLEKLVPYLFRIGEINAQKYPVGRGGYPWWHSEVYPQVGNNDAMQRILLFMYYLNDVEEGGETDFYYQDISIKPKAGRMVIAPAYFTHTHRGQMPVSSDKYILTSWILFNPADKIYTD